MGISNRTPGALRSRRAEGPALIGEVIAQRGTLSWEDATMFARRLSRAEATEIAVLTEEDRMKIALKLRALHERVRGCRVEVDLEGILAPAAVGVTPRSLVRSVIDALERATPFAE